MNARDFDFTWVKPPHFRTVVHVFEPLQPFTVHWISKHRPWTVDDVYHLRATIRVALLNGGLSPTPKSADIYLDGPLEATWAIHPRDNKIAMFQFSSERDEKKIIRFGLEGMGNRIVFRVDLEHKILEETIWYTLLPQIYISPYD